MEETIRYNDFNLWLRGRFGERVQKLSVDAGFTCPNRDGTISTGGCIFCNPKGSGTGAHAKGLTITEQIEKGKVGLFKRYKARKFLVYFQAFTNTYAPLSRLESVYGEALSVPGVQGLSIGTRPDCVDSEKIALLGGYAEEKMIWVEYGLQSIHDRSLAVINRGHDFRCFEEAVAMTKKTKVMTCAHVILGLPGESRSEMLENARVLGGMGIDGIKLHLLYVVKGTALEKIYKEGNFTCLEQDEYVELICDFLERLPSEVVIHRLTGDPHPWELVAPSWPLRKNETFGMIKQTMKERDSWQGKHAGV